jgi:hypothetical protein
MNYYFLPGFIFFLLRPTSRNNDWTRLLPWLDDVAFVGCWFIFYLLVTYTNKNEMRP